MVKKSIQEADINVVDLEEVKDYCVVDNIEVWGWLNHELPTGRTLYDDKEVFLLVFILLL